MLIQIRARNIEVTELLRDHVERKLAFAIGRLEARIDHVTVRFSDTNGPNRGGVDKRCQIEVGLRPSANVRVEDTDADWFAAFDRAAERASRRLARACAFDREREIAARPPRRAAH